MVKKCIVNNCDSQFTSFHELPADEHRRMLWINQLQHVATLDPGRPEYQYVCGNHFEDACFHPTNKARILKRDAIPTIFENVPEGVTLLPYIPKVIPVVTSNSDTVKQEPGESPKPYFQSAKAYLKDRKKIGLLCRTCHRVIYDKSYFPLYSTRTSSSLQRIIKDVLPSLDLKIYAKPVMCLKCVRMLFDCYEFKKKCLNAEKRLEKWVSKVKNMEENVVNLMVPVEESTESDHFIVQSQENGDITSKSDDITSKSDDITINKNITSNSVEAILVESEEDIVVNEAVSEHNYASTSQSSSSNHPKMKKRFNFKPLLDQKSVLPKKIKGPFLCEHCGSVLDDYRSFKAHVSDHATVPRSCYLCPFVTKSAKKFQSHVNSHSAPSYKCDRCDKAFKREISLRLHEKTHYEVVSSQQCHICGKEYGKNLNVHIKHVHHEGPPMLCHVCGKEFSNLRNLRSHLQIHNFEFRFKCEVCGKKFQFRTKFKRHVNMHARVKFSCEKCGKGMKYKESWERHRLLCNGKGKSVGLRLEKKAVRENNCRCVICWREFPDEEALDDHAMRRHTVEVEESEEETQIGDVSVGGDNALEL